MNNHRELEVWQYAKDLAADVYKITRKFPKEELYGLTDQMNSKNLKRKTIEFRK